MKGEQQVEAALKSYEDVDSWKTVIFLYNAALKEVGTKLEISVQSDRAHQDEDQDAGEHREEAQTLRIRDIH